MSLNKRMMQLNAYHLKRCRPQNHERFANDLCVCVLRAQQWVACLRAEDPVHCVWFLYLFACVCIRKRQRNAPALSHTHINERVSLQRHFLKVEKQDQHKKRLTQFRVVCKGGCGSDDLGNNKKVKSIQALFYEMMQHKTRPCHSISFGCFFFFFSSVLFFFFCSLLATFWLISFLQIRLLSKRNNRLALSNREYIEFVNKC